MRVLHLPSNIASQISILVNALCDLGIEARGLVRNNSVIQDIKNVEAITVLPRRQYPLRSTWQILHWWYAVRSALQWADVVHWHFQDRALPWNLDLKYIKWQRKPRFVTFWGSDIRVPEVATADNPYLAELLANPHSGYALSYQSSRNTQSRFAHYGFQCFVPGPELGKSVLPELFPTPIHTEASVITSDFIPCYPDPERRKPVIVHMPSKLAVKGTDSVLAAIEQLKPHYDFEFRLIHNVPHTEAVSMMCDCDLMLDQFVIGSFGTAALEAMALGKPVVCYLTPSVVAQLPPDAPFINANRDNLAKVLSSLLTDGSRRQEIGRQSRAYVEKYHDAHTIAQQLINIYKNYEYS
jgi:hypothetical protein